uniref:Transforming growth factor-beta receptor-associated protein 1 n=1 Tax=Toxocara canis TaxID=6265 RepID=A0A183UTL9_TOXCA
LKRSPDAMWKAFVSAALNEKKLPAWIRIIFRTRQIVETCFQPWAYVARTGCEDCYELLERLHKYHFELPVDLAVMQQLTNKLVSESTEYGTIGKNFLRDQCLIMGTDPFRLREVRFDASMCMASNEQTKDDNSIQVTCVDGSSKFLYFGTTHGNIVRLELHEEDHAEVRDVLQLPTKSAAVQLVAASAVECLIVVSASKMFYVDMNSLQVLSAGTSSNVVCIALNSDPVTEDPFALQIALATSNRMILACERSGKNSYVRQRINTEENVIAICYSRYCICYATQCEYFVYSITGNATLSLFPYQLESTKPLIVNIDTVRFPEEFLVSGMQGLAVFASSDGVSSRPPLVWGSDRVVSTVYHSPYIFALNSTSLIVFMCNEASEVHRMTVIEGTLLSNINGRIFLCVKDQIFMIDEVSWFDRAETLLAQNSVERALKLAEQSVLSASYDEEEILKMNRLKQKAALIYFRDEVFEECSDLAISCEMDPRELMFHYAHFEFPIPPFQVSDFNVDTVGEVDTTSAKHLDFLEEHLLRVRDLHWSKPYKQDLDTALVCLLSRRGNFLEENSVPQLLCSLDECKRWMCDRDRVPFYVSLALECGNVQDAFGTCRQLLNEGRLGANLHRLCLKNFSKITDPKTVLDSLEFLLQVGAASTVRSLENLSIEVDPVEVVKHLEPYRDQLIFYLERMKPLQMASLDTKLASLYVEEIVQLSQSMENDQKEIAKNYRTRLRHLLFESCNLDNEKVAHDMKRWPQFTVESVLLEGKTQASEECLERLLNDYHDYDAAELYCLHMNAKNKRLFRILLKSYLKVVKTQPEFKSRVVKMLQSINEPGDELEIISEFPDDWPLQAFSSFAAKALSTYTYRLHCDKFKTAALSMAMRHLTCELEGSTSAKIEIDDHTRCAACGTAIGSEEVALYPHSETLVHRSCTKYSHLCPKTNTIA